MLSFVRLITLSSRNMMQVNVGTVFTHAASRVPPVTKHRIFSCASRLSLQSLRHSILAIPKTTPDPESSGEMVYDGRSWISREYRVSSERSALPYAIPLRCSRVSNLDFPLPSPSYYILSGVAITFYRATITSHLDHDTRPCLAAEPRST